MISGMKNTAIEAPCTTVGTSNVAKSAEVLKCERMNSTAARMVNATVAKIRGSTLCTVLPTTGVSRIASTPTGASTMPASVAV